MEREGFGPRGVSCATQPGRTAREVIQAEIREIIAEVASRLRKPLLVEDDRQRVVAYSPQYERVDEMRREAILTGSLRPEVMEWSDSFGIRLATGPIRTPPDRARGILGRVCVPVRYEGVLVGFIWALDDERELDAEGLVILSEAASAIGIHLYRDRMERQLGSDLLRALISTSPRVRSAAAQDAAVRDVLPQGTDALIVVIRGATNPARIVAAMRQRLPRLFELRNELEMVALLPIRRLAAARAARVLESAIRDADTALAIGLSDPQPSSQSLHLAYRQASDAAWIVSRFRGLGPVGEWSRLGAYRLLARAAADEDAVDLLDGRLAPVLADPQLALTLETYLDLGCRPKEAADALHVHRGTLYNRLQKIETLTGADLHSGIDRLSLHLGLKLHHVRQAQSAGPSTGELTTPASEGQPHETCSRGPARRRRHPPDPATDPS